MIDLHTHLLPGLDDGAPDLASALEMARFAAACGTTHLMCTPHLHLGRRVMTLHHLFVEDGLRGNGIGRHLVAATVAEARRQECAQLVVGTRPENIKAQALYRSLGFLPQDSGGPRFHLDLPADGALPPGWV